MTYNILMNANRKNFIGFIKDSKLTYTDIASIAGLSENYIGQLCQGYRRLTPKLLKKIILLYINSLEESERLIFNDEELLINCFKSLKIKPRILSELTGDEILKSYKIFDKSKKTNQKLKDYLYIKDALNLHFLYKKQVLTFYYSNI